MELKLNLNYDQILKLIHQLPQDKFEKLATTLQSELRLQRKASKDKLKKLILAAPTWNDRQLKQFEESRAFINSSRLG